MKRNKMIRWLIFAGLVLGSVGMTFFTGYMGSLGSWTEENLSVVGYWYDHRKLLIAWGFLAGILFVGYMVFIIYLAGYNGKTVKFLAALAGILLITGVFIPYTPVEEPFWSDVHIVVSFCAPVSLLVGIVFMQIWLLCQGFSVKSDIAMLMVFTVFAALIFIHYTIITSVLEVYTVAAASVLLGRMAAKLLLQKDTQNKT